MGIWKWHETWWQLQCEFRLLKNSCRLCHHLLWLLSPVSGSSFSSGSVTQGEENKRQIQIPFCPWVDEKKNTEKRFQRITHCRTYYRNLSSLKTLFWSTFINNDKNGSIAQECILFRFSSTITTHTCKYHFYIIKYNASLPRWPNQ